MAKALAYKGSITAGSLVAVARHCTSEMEVLCGRFNEVLVLGIFYREHDSDYVTSQTPP